MGRGTTAAIVMSEMRSALRAYAVLDPAPATVLARMEQLVLAQPVNEQLVILAYALVSPDRRTLRLALAGHPPPLIGDTRRDASTCSSTAAAPPSGWAPGRGRRPRSTFAPRPLVMLYSDGLVESRHRDLFDGIDELVGHVDCHPRATAPASRPVHPTGAPDGRQRQ